MSKKKILMFLLVIVIVVGAVVGGIMLFSPKPNSELIYSLNYNISKNKHFENVKTINSDLLNYMQQFPDSTDPEKDTLVNESQSYCSSFVAICSLTNTCKKFDEFSLNNVLFLNEKNLVKNQQALKSAYNELNKSIEICFDFYTNNIKHLVENNNTLSYAMFNQIKNYSTHMNSLAKNLGDFYYYLATILSNNAKSGFVINDYTRLVCKTTAEWVKQVAHNILNTNVKIDNFSLDLNSFITTQFALNFQDYEFDTLMQQTVELSQNVEIDKIIDAMKNNSLSEYVNSFDDIDLRKLNSDFIYWLFKIEVEVK